MEDSARHDGHEQIESLIKTIAEKSCEKRLAGIAIGVIVDGKPWSAFGGWADGETKKPVTEATIFEIGSLSKLFTSLLLAVATTKQEVNLDDPVQDALGQQVALPSDGKSQITYRSLANHRSSLPRLPDDLIATADMTNPYAHYDQEMLYACLNRMKSVAPIGSQGEYSNLGVGLLGHALGKIAGSDYHTALRERVLIPLGMQDTSTESCEHQQAHLATAHKKKGKPTAHWDFTEVTVAAGGVRSTLSDMFKFLRANIDPPTSPLKDEIEMMHQPSELPRCEGNRRRLIPKELLQQGVALVLVFLVVDAVGYLLVGKPVDLRFYAITAVTFAAAFRWGWIAGSVALALLTWLSWWYGGGNFEVSVTLIAGMAVVLFGSIWKMLWREIYVMRGGGEGRLAWQRSQVGDQPMLWHNGMVGGSASFLGFVPEYQLGVIVLTNTAKLVDSTGMKILSELVKLKENDSAAAMTQRREAGELQNAK